MSFNLPITIKSDTIDVVLSIELHNLNPALDDQNRNPMAMD